MQLWGRIFSEELSENLHEMLQCITANQQIACLACIICYSQECSWDMGRGSEVPEELAEEQWTYHSEPVAGQFIVRFRDYKMAEQHKQALAAGLPNNRHWKYVDRNNAAARFPTDFALLEIEFSDVEAIKVG